jgi:sortase A
MKKMMLLLFLIVILTACSVTDDNDEQPTVVKADSAHLETPIQTSLQTSIQQAEQDITPVEPKTTAIVPVRIQIPKIKVDAEVIEVGLLPDGQMEAPEDDAKVGWFEPGYQPGSNGSSVMAGHVDNKTGPAVFFYLKKLDPGDEIHVSDAEGKTLAFIVTDVAAYKTEESPIDTIFGPSDVPMLNLITCTGTYSKKTDEHDQRLVVYSKLKQ